MRAVFLAEGCAVAAEDVRADEAVGRACSRHIARVRQCNLPIVFWAAVTIVIVMMIALVKCDLVLLAFALLLVQLYGGHQIVHRVLAVLPAAGCCSRVVWQAVAAT